MDIIRIVIIDSYSEQSLMR